jgi:hypothetical protein
MVVDVEDHDIALRLGVGLTHVAARHREVQARRAVRVGECSEDATHPCRRRRARRAQQRVAARCLKPAHTLDASFAQHERADEGVERDAKHLLRRLVSARLVRRVVQARMRSSRSVSVETSNAAARCPRCAFGSSLSAIRRTLRSA